MIAVWVVIVATLILVAIQANVGEPATRGARAVATLQVLLVVTIIAIIAPPGWVSW